MVLACVKSQLFIQLRYLPPGEAQPAQQRASHRLSVLPENLEAIFPPVPFGRSLASFLGEARVGLGHPYSFTRSSVIFSCAPACGTFSPRRWPAASPEPCAKDGGVVDAQTGMPVSVPLLCLFQFALLRVDRAGVC